MTEVASIRIFAILLGLASSFMQAGVAADEQSSVTQSSVIDRHWTFQGFGTLGYAQTDKYDNTYFRRDISQDAVRLRDDPYLMDSRIGLQVTGELSDHWDFVGQAVLKQKIEADASDYISIAFARYTTTNNWQFTLGRQPFDLFLVSEHRNVGYAYDWVRPPIEFYGALPSDSFDGIKVARSWGDFDQDWYWHLSLGRIDDQFQLTVPLQDSILENARAVETITIEPIYTTGITWLRDKWQLHAGFSWLEIEPQLEVESNFGLLVDAFSGLWPDLNRIGDELLGKNTIRYYSLGLKWDSAPWKVQSEISHVDADNASFAGQRAYFSVSRRFDDWLGYVVLGFARDNTSVNYQPIDEMDIPDDEFIRAILQATQAEVDFRLAALKQNQKSLTLGVRWDFASERAVKFQCDRFRFDGGSNALIDRVNNAYLNDETQTFCSFAFDWVF